MKNVVFDCGNVLVRVDFEGLLKKCSPDLEVQDIIRNFLFPDRWKAYDRGVICSARLYREAVEACPHLEKEFRSFWEHWFESICIDRKNTELVQKVRDAGYGVYLLSDMPYDVLEFLKDQDYFDAFDGYLASCSIQCLKPEQAMYETLTDRYGLNPAECFFIDDRPDNVEGARQAGWNGAVLERMEDLETLLNEEGFLNS